MRVLVPAGAARQGATIVLDEDESHHLRVRRAIPGTDVELRDGRGLAGRGVLRARGKGWEVEVVEASEHPAPSGLTLAVAAGDRERFLWLVEKAAELGVSRVVPLITARTEGVATRLRREQAERLTRKALEATKQSGALWSPAVTPPARFEDFLRQAIPGARWLAAPGGRPPDPVSGEVTVLVGPEGGLTDPERAAALAAGWTPVAFGPNVLRFETAALAAAAWITTERGRGS
ncbi:MAG TPA: RsmE family RNA methyltransferase [Gemmatimonadales bacterium]|nr:RsmE family RNA methyltransferase [Gemmatimonadales bacterium]